jgi:hypothetical protein
MGDYNRDQLLGKLKGHLPNALALALVDTFDREADVNELAHKYYTSDDETRRDILELLELDPSGRFPND